MKKILWLIWKNPTTRIRYKVGTLTVHMNNYDFRYNSNECNFEEIGFDYFPGFSDVKKIYSSQTLFESILNRLPNKNRPDYNKIIESYGLNEESSDIEILEKTKGRLLTDTFEFVPEFNFNKIEFEIAGTRHYSGLKKCKKELKIGDKLTLEIENNDYDENAVIVKFEKYKLGYVPRYYSKQLSDLLKRNIVYKAYISNINIQSKIYDDSITAKVELIFNK